MGVCASDSSWHSLLFLLFQLSVGKNKLLIYRLQIFFRRASLPGEVIQMGYIEESLSDQTVGRGCSNRGLSLTRTYASARTHRAVFSNWNPVPVSQLTQVQRTRSLSLHNMEMPLSVLFWHNVGSAGQATVCLTTPIRSRPIKQHRSHGHETHGGLPKAVGVVSARGYPGFVCQRMCIQVTHLCTFSLRSEPGLALNKQVIFLGNHNWESWLCFHVKHRISSESYTSEAQF